jgi:hypothetical protein
MVGLPYKRYSTIDDDEESAAKPIFLKTKKLGSPPP